MEDATDAQDSADLLDSGDWVDVVEYLTSNDPIHGMTRRGQSTKITKNSADPTKPSAFVGTTTSLPKHVGRKIDGEEQPTRIDFLREDAPKESRGARPYVDHNPAPSGEAPQLCELCSNQIICG